MNIEITEDDFDTLIHTLSHAQHYNLFNAEFRIKISELYKKFEKIEAILDEDVK